MRRVTLAQVLLAVMASGTAASVALVCSGCRAGSQLERPLTPRPLPEPAPCSRVDLTLPDPYAPGHNHLSDSFRARAGALLDRALHGQPRAASETSVPWPVACLERLKGGDWIEINLSLGPVGASDEARVRAVIGVYGGAKVTGEWVDEHGSFVGPGLAPTAQVVVVSWPDGRLLRADQLTGSGPSDGAQGVREPPGPFDTPRPENTPPAAGLARNWAAALIWAGRAKRDPDKIINLEGRGEPGADDPLGPWAWSPDGGLLAACGPGAHEDSTSHADATWWVYLWRTEGKETAPRSIDCSGGPGAKPRVKPRWLRKTSLAFSPDGKTLAVSLEGARTSYIAVVDVSSERVLATIPFLRWSPDHPDVVMFGRRGRVRCPPSKEPPHLGARALRFSSDGALIAADWDYCAQIFRVRDGARVAALSEAGPPNRDPVFCGGTSPDIALWISPYGNVWDIWKREMVGCIGGGGFRPKAAWWTGDGRTLVTAGTEAAEPAYVQAWDPRTSTEVGHWEWRGKDDVPQVAAEPGGTRAAVATPDGSAVVLDPARPEHPMRIGCPADAGEVVFGPHGVLMVRLDVEGDRCVWEMREAHTGAALMTVGPIDLPAGPRGATASPDGRWAAFRTAKGIALYRLGFGSDKPAPTKRGA